MKNKIIEDIKDIDVVDMLETSMLTYGIASQRRVIPLNIDGLKLVQRRILYSMYQNDTGKLQKNVVNLGRAAEYVDTGDSSIYGSLIFLGQKDRHIHPIIDLQGNTGYITGSLSDYAAARYTEAKLSQYTKDWFFPEEFEYTDWMNNYINTGKEPVALPTLIPMGLVHGTSAIAYGVNMSSPCLGLQEVCQSYIRFLEFKEKKTHIDKKTENKIYEPLKFKFANGCKVLRYSENLFSTGRGTITMQGEYHIESGDRGRTNIVITRLPYLVETSKFLETLSKIPNELQNLLYSINDESNKDGMRVIITLKQGVDHKPFIEYLLTPNKGVMAGNRFTSNSLSQYNMMSHEHGIVLPHSVLRMYEDHLSYKEKVLNRFFNARETQLQNKLDYLEVLLYIIGNNERREKFINTITKSKDTQELSAKLEKAFSGIRVDLLLAVAERNFKVLLRNCGDIKDQINKIKEELKEVRYFKSHKIEYMINKIKETANKYK